MQLKSPSPCLVHMNCSRRGWTICSRTVIQVSSFYSLYLRSRIVNSEKKNIENSRSVVKSIISHKYISLRREQIRSQKIVVLRVKPIAIPVMVIIFPSTYSQPVRSSQRRSKIGFRLATTPIASDNSYQHYQSNRVSWILLPFSHVVATYCQWHSILLLHFLPQWACQVTSLFLKPLIWRYERHLWFQLIPRVHAPDLTWPVALANILALAKHPLSSRVGFKPLCGSDEVSRNASRSTNSTLLKIWVCRVGG